MITHQTYIWWDKLRVKGGVNIVKVKPGIVVINIGVQVDIAIIIVVAIVHRYVKCIDYRSD
ncbi:hypothetical protein K503DRAFT_776001 [Rhizopogon vinicolor AM-OR11-026]|uniref:Uncharacterized protein n=1 Tax=Rhizopogon vinicolor AM-OR11-026 TaxID=1314800 RepID=A0A1B7MKE3_9AGAM|nr:hypothetical protein K503DRAFT_776001 [Rhizopogon vinicolor AM-OR11-026]